MSKEAMKLALEALEKCDFALAEELAAWDIDPPLHHVLEASNACGPAITAICEALAEQQTDWEAVAADQAMTIALLRAEQPQQEPVAIIASLMPAERHALLEEGYSIHEPLYTSPQPAQQQEPVLWLVNGVVQVSDIPKEYTGCLFTSPQPSKPWVGLTDKDYQELHLQMGPTYFYQDYGKAIEAKLKEKNNG